MTTTSSAGDRFRRVDAIFDAALDLPAGELTAFVDRECGDDPALRTEVLELVRAYHRGDSVLESPAAQVAAPLIDAAAAAAGTVPERIGAFRVVREIGSGGMGRVFLGERADGQFDQRVAIKLIRDGGPGVLRRFLEERRILARLEHPGIARLLDGGVTAGGLPYFAMELIEGEPIDAWCERRSIGLEQRLELVARVGDAVAYAHQHLIIHRDLKPSNILVADSGQVKLLDFGIAKLLGEETSSDLTRTGFSAMTPEFAAPEQIRGAPVSTGTDVYALGVLLYLLLTGERPYDLRGRSPAEVERIVCVEPPSRASSRVRAAWRRRVSGDLDLIVLTALQKEEHRRYRSPAALADDLRRWLAGQPILARPDTARYRVGKFLRRHRLAVAGAVVLVLGLAGAVARETVLGARAEAEARKAREVEKYLVSAFNVADPNAWEEPEGGKVTVRELVDREVRRIDSSLVGEPEVQSELRSVLGRIYTNLGLYDQATPLLRNALAQRVALHGAADSGAVATEDLLGVALTQLNQYDEAEPLLRHALEERRRFLGSAHPATAETIEHLATLLEERNAYEAAEPLYREVLAIRRSNGDSTVEVATALGNLGLLLRRKGVYAEAESLHREALGIELRLLGEDHPLTAASMQNLAQTLQTRGFYEESEQYHRRALEAKRTALGDAHPSVTLSMNNLANLLSRQLGRAEEAETLAVQALAGDRKTFGESHSYVAASLANLGVIYRLEGRFSEADSLLRLALDMNRRVFGEHHERIASNLGALALTRSAMGDGDGAIRYMRQSLDEYRRVLGDEHRNTVTTQGNLALILAEYGDPAEAESLARMALSRLDPAKPEHRAQRISTELGLGKALLAQGKIDEALAVLAEVVDGSRAQFGEGNWRTGDALLTYGTALLAQRRYDEADPVLRNARVALKDVERTQPRLAARARAAIQRLPQ